MDEHTSHELAYKKGYEQGKRDAIEKLQVELEQTRNERNTLEKELFNLAVSVSARSTGNMTPCLFR